MREGRGFEVGTCVSGCECMCEHSSARIQSERVGHAMQSGGQEKLGWVLLLPLAVQQKAAVPVILVVHQLLMSAAVRLCGP